MGGFLSDLVCISLLHKPLIHVGSVPPKMLSPLIKLAHLEMAKLQKERKLSLFPAESYVDEVIAALNQKTGCQGTGD